MSERSVVLPADRITGRGSSLNPFLVLRDTAVLIAFATAVPGAREVVEARIATPSGTLILAELRIGDSLLLLADPQEGWPVLPGLLQLWVANMDEVLAAAERAGSRTVTPPTPFAGEVRLGRVEDPWGDLWWLFQPAPGRTGPVPVREGGPDVVFRTVDEYLRGRG